MRLMKRENRTVLLIILAFCLILPFTGLSAGPERVNLNMANPENLAVPTGKSMILQSQTPIKRFSIADPKIADVIVLTPRQVYITGKSPGVTSLTFWGEGNKLSAVFDIEVAPDVTSLKNKLHKIFPDEKGIKVAASGDSIILSGTVSNAANLSQVLALAGAQDKQKVINLMEVGGVHQVMLEVRVSEMSKSLGRRLGINFGAIGRIGPDGTFKFLSTLVTPGVAAPFVNLSGSYFRGEVTWTGLIDAMKERGLVKVLAEPTLITMSGKKADFLAGGEYPVPVPQATGAGGTSAITIEYRKYGVGLNFTPTVLGNGKISMDVSPEVSDLDFTNAIVIGTYVVPALSVRRVSTTVELADGQSFAVAGLLREDVREAINKVPFLGDIPILGLLFRSSNFQKSETELVIIVTPHLVKPLDMAKQTLPTDQFIEPNDLEFYLLGLAEGRGDGRTNTTTDKSTSSQPAVSAGGGLDGDFGHIVP